MAQYKLAETLKKATGVNLKVLNLSKQILKILRYYLENLEII